MLFDLLSWCVPVIWRKFIRRTLFFVVTAAAAANNWSFYGICIPFFLCCVFFLFTVFFFRLSFSSFITSLSSLIRLFSPYSNQIHSIIIHRGNRSKITFLWKCKAIRIEWHTMYANDLGVQMKLMNRHDRLSRSKSSIFKSKLCLYIYQCSCSLCDYWLLLIAHSIKLFQSLKGYQHNYRNHNLEFVMLLI